MTTCKNCGHDFETADSYYGHGCPSAGLTVQATTVIEPGTDEPTSSLLDSLIAPVTDQSTANFLEKPSEVGS